MYVGYYNIFFIGNYSDLKKKEREITFKIDSARSV
jgi:hypothetical protein